VQSINDEPLPELPQEEWEFIKILPGYEVEVDVEAITSDKLFLMQCGSFRQFEQADSMKATMALAGLEPQIRGSNNGWYRVILGPYDSRRDAEKDRHKLQGVNIHSCKIWLWNL
jgi:cell division protein FtsN